MTNVIIIHETYRNATKISLIIKTEIRNKVEFTFINLCTIIKKEML